jgi:phospholipid transport system substrate-binding protein
MHLPRLVYAAGLSIALTVYAPPGLAADKAVALVTQFGDKTIQIFKDPLIGAPDREHDFRALVDEYFDFPAIAKFVLGRYWKTASEDERQQFTAAFEDHMVRAYAARFSDYKGENFKVMPARLEGDNGTIVPAEILRPDGQPSAVLDWKVQDLRIRDVSVSGVSMALTYRDEFAAVVRDNNGQVAALTAALRARDKLQRP